MDCQLVIDMLDQIKLAADRAKARLMDADTGREFHDMLDYIVVLNADIRSEVKFPKN